MVPTFLFLKKMEESHKYLWEMEEQNLAYPLQSFTYSDFIMFIKVWEYLFRIPFKHFMEDINEDLETEIVNNYYDWVNDIYKKTE